MSGWQTLPATVLVALVALPQWPWGSTGQGHRLKCVLKNPKMLSWGHKHHRMPRDSTLFYHCRRGTVLVLLESSQGERSQTHQETEPNLGSPEVALSPFSFPDKLHSSASKVFAQSGRKSCEKLHHKLSLDETPGPALSVQPSFHPWVLSNTRRAVVAEMFASLLDVGALGFTNCQERAPAASSCPPAQELPDGEETAF